MRILENLFSTERDHSRPTAPEPSSKHFSINPLHFNHGYHYPLIEWEGKTVNSQSFPSLSQVTTQASCHEGSHCMQWWFSFAPAHVFLIPQRVSLPGDYICHFILRLIPFSTLIGTLSLCVFISTLVFFFLCLLLSYLRERDLERKGKRERQSTGGEG